MSVEKSSGDQYEKETLLEQYANKQDEVARLIQEKRKIGGGLSPAFSMSEPVLREKIEKEYGPKVSKAFAELRELQIELDAKKIKARTMEERGI